MPVVANVLEKLAVALAVPAVSATGVEPVNDVPVVRSKNDTVPVGMAVPVEPLAPTVTENDAAVPTVTGLATVARIRAAASVELTDSVIDCDELVLKLASPL